MKDQTISDWLNALGSKTPTPGGGAVAGLNGAIATAQLMMVSNYTKAGLSGRPETLGQKISTFLELAEQDSKAYSQVHKTYKSNDKLAIQQSLLDATEPSANVVAGCEDLYHFCNVNLELFNKNLLADLVVVLANIRASVESAQSMLLVNSKAMDEARNKVEIQQKIKYCDELISKIDDLKTSVKAKIA